MKESLFINYLEANCSRHPCHHDTDAVDNCRVHCPEPVITSFKIAILCSTVGVLTVIRSLDRETTSSYLLNISAADSGVPSLSSVMALTVVVRDVNDNPPVFVQSLYNVSISENQPPGVNVVIVSATDFDDPTSKQICFAFSLLHSIMNL